MNDRENYSESIRQNRIPAALDSFKTALRLEPNLEWARQGLVESLKAQNGLYRFILGVDRFRVGMVKGPRLLLLLIPQIRALYWLLALIVFSTRPFFTVLLSFDSYGKLTLTAAEVRRSRWIAGSISIVVFAILLVILLR